MARSYVSVHFPHSRPEQRINASLLSFLLYQCQFIFKYATYDGQFGCMLGVCWENSMCCLRTFHVVNALRCNCVTLVRLLAKIVCEN